LRQELKKGDAADGFKVQQLLRTLNGTLKRDYTADTLPRRPADPWPKAAAEVHAQWWEGRIARQREIDASIAAQADQEFLYDKPYEDRSVVRVAGPFTVESLSPHRVLTVDADDELVLPGQFINDEKSSYGDEIDFTSVILENLKTAGVQQSHKEDRITFTSLVGWPGHYLCAEGRYLEGESNKERRAGIFIGPEFGTVPRADLVAAAREAADAGFDVLIACAFNYDAHSAEFERLGRIPVLKARMNADLHMADALKNTGAGNLFVIFGEPDITVNSGKWLVTRSGRMVAPYGSVTKLPGLGSVEAINRLGREDLPRLKRLSSGREVWADQSGTAGGGLGAGEHRGRGSTQRDGGISSESERSQRLPGRSGDAADPGASVELPAGNGSQNSVAGSSRNRQDAQWPEALSGLQTLQPADFPLTLTTDHFTQVTIHGVDIFHPQSGQVRSSDPDDIACWFIDTNYNEESFFVRHAYFLGANDPYKALKTTLKAEIDHEAWSTLHSDTSRPFPKPETGRIAVKVINHLGDEVMKVFSVG
jgi:adenine-specific DNA-methyltransferase